MSVPQLNEPGLHIRRGRFTTEIEKDKRLKATSSASLPPSFCAFAPFALFVVNFQIASFFK
jgi:hypothetical protein